MRPVRLTLKGFTSYRDEQSIDFSDFEVFAITGPMGAGKSSLLDAITYALYGRVERVGSHCVELISQGLPRLAVQLDFSVGGHLHRITRSTPRTGQTRVALERIAPDGTVSSYGEGADKVAECRELIVRLLGLDYDAFTRSVLLPQGKFAALLTGEPAKRREILTELLGLQLFDRLGKRAGKIAREARDLADAKASVLALEFVGVTEEARRAAQERAGAQRLRAQALTKAHGELTELHSRWESEQREAELIRSCAEQLGKSERALLDAAGTFEKIAPTLKTAQDALTVSEKNVATNREQLGAARSVRAAAEKDWGGPLALAKARADAVRVRDLDTECTSSAQAIEKLEGTYPKLRDQIDRRSGAVDEAKTELGTARDRLANAKTTLEAAQHGNRVAAISAGLKAGDPCPVCGVQLAKAPKHAIAQIAAAERALRRTEEASEAAQESLQRSKLDLQKARDALARAEESVAQEQSAIREKQKELSRMQKVLRAALGELEVDDAVAEFDRRLRGLESLQTAERDAAAALERASITESKALQRLEQLRTHGAEQRAAVTGLLASAREQIDALPAAQALSITLAALPDTQGTLERVGAAVRANATTLGDAVKALEAVRAARVASKDLLSAAKKIGDAHDLAGVSIVLLRDASMAAAQAAGASAATAVRDAEHLAERLQHRALVESEIAQHRERAEIFAALATELRADHIVAFLQSEALQLLARAASAYLLQFTESRYQLRCRNDDEFCVVDRWTGDEVRSVETLSGGETFVAALALALALSDQLRLLSVTERAEIDSLFLDEGFGTLDPETLATVTSAIYALSGDGRLIGVITHVPELAEQFPRIVVTKSPRGSRLEVVS